MSTVIHWHDTDAWLTRVVSLADLAPGLYVVNVSPGGIWVGPFTDRAAVDAYLAETGVYPSDRVVEVGTPHPQRRSTDR